MMTISRQLRKYFVFIAMLSIIFVTIVSNISITIFFSKYIKESRQRDDLKVVQYIEKIYSNNNGLDSQALMNIMHYAFSEAITVRLKDMDENIIWTSGTPETMHIINDDDGNSDNGLAFRNYPLNQNGNKIGTIDVGRPRSIISSLEDRKFIQTINGIFIIAFVFSIIIAMMSSSRISQKFLKPIYLLKENSKLIENGKYKKLNDIETNTVELHDLSVSIHELAERLYHQESLRKRMTSDIAHELRTPLATLQSHIEAFMDGIWQPTPDKLTIIYDEILRLTKLIKDLSDLSIMENDEINLNINQIDLSSLLDNIVESFEPLFLNKNILLKKEIQNNVYYLGDTDRLNQVFVNILSNAYKYTDKKGVVNVALKKSNNIIKITVEDTGIGIPEENVKHVFERFYRSDLSRNRETGGTGIGLTISKAFIEAHSGSIKIKSEEGKGTQVIIELNVNK